MCACVYVCMCKCVKGEVEGMARDVDGAAGINGYVRVSIRHPPYIQATQGVIVYQ